MSEYLLSKCVEEERKKLGRSVRIENEKYGDVWMNE